MTTIVTRAAKGSALTWTEGDDNFTNLNTDKLENLVEDTTPELGGPLDVGSHYIQSTLNGITLIPASGETIDLVGNVIVGEQNTNTTITTDGTSDLILNTNGGTNSGAVTIQDGTSGQIQITPATSGLVFINGQTVGLRTNNTGGAIIGRAATTTAGAYQYPSLVVQKHRTDITTASMTNEPAVLLFQTRDSASVNNSFGRLSCTYQGSSDNPYFEFRVSTNGFTTSQATLLSMGAGQARFGVLDVDYELTTYGTGDLILSTDQGANTGNVFVNNMIFNEVVYGDGTTTGTITPNAADGSIQEITLTGNITLNAFADPVAGQSITLIVKQPSSGGPYTLTSSMLFAGGSKTLSTAADAVDIISVFYTGSQYLASLSKGYA